MGIELSRSCVSGKGCRPSTSTYLRQTVCTPARIPVALTPFLIFALAALPIHAQQQAEPERQPAAAAATADTPEDMDRAPVLYAQKCIGCHTIGGGALSGPDLKPTSNWPRQDLRAAILRMEEKVGPMSEDEIETLTDFLLDPGAAERLEAQRQQAAMRHAAQLEPPSVDKGRDLFHGMTTLMNEGISCSACHQAGGWGGNVASSLEESYTRIGETPLMSTIESPGFPVMRAIYTDEPVTKQEAAHIVAYLKHIDENPQEATVIPLELIGVIGTIAFMALLARLYRNRQRGTRARLVARASYRDTRKSA